MPPERGAPPGMSFFSVGGNLGFAFGPLIATPLLLAFGLRGAALLIFPATVMALIMAAHGRRFADLRQTVTARRSHLAEHLQDAWKPFSRLTAAITCRSIVFYGLNTFIPLYWIANLHASKAAAGFALTLFAGTGALGTLIGGRLADRLGRRIIVAGSLAVLCPAILALLLAPSGWLAMICLVPVALTLYASNSVMVVMARSTCRTTSAPPRA